MAKKRILHDKFFKQAKAEGYAARSAYKLKQIQEKRRLLRAGDWVLDLGCAPGSWLQVAGEIVAGAGGKGRAGRVVGIDLQEVEVELPPSAKAFVRDAFEVEPIELLRLVNGEGEGGTPAAELRRFDAMISDMAPSTEGDAGDHFRSAELCRRVLSLTPLLLKAGGNLVMKIFEGAEYPAVLKETAALFKESKGIKPEATRSVSKEMFIVAKGYTGPIVPVEDEPDEGRA